MYYTHYRLCCFLLLLGLVMFCFCLHFQLTVNALTMIMERPKSLVCERHSDVSLATFAGGSLGKWQSLWSRQGQVERGAFRLRDPECGSYSSLEHYSYTIYKMSQAKKWYFLLQSPAPSRTIPHHAPERHASYLSC